MRFILTVALLAAVSSVNAQLSGVLSGSSVPTFANITNSSGTPSQIPVGTFAPAASSAPATVPVTSAATIIQSAPITVITPAQQNATYELGQSINSTGVKVNNLGTCLVIDPTRTEKPWANSTQAYPQVYDEATYVCVDGNFLCPSTAPLRCQYACYTSTQYTCTNGTLQTVPHSGALNTTAIDHSLHALLQ